MKNKIRKTDQITSKSQIEHRNIEWFGLEKTLKLIWFQLPYYGQGHLPVDQGAQSRWP